MATAVINCCEDHTDGVRSEYQNEEFSRSCETSYLESLIRGLEVKFERDLKSANEEWQIKFEAHERIIARLTQELSETNMRLKLSQDSFPPVDSETSSSAIGNKDCAVNTIDDIELPRTLVFDKGRLRGSQSDKESNGMSSNSMLQDSDPVQNLSSYRDAQDAEMLNHQIASFQKDVSSLLSKLELTREDSLQIREKCSKDIELLKMQVMDLESKTGSMQLVLTSIPSLSEQENVSNVDATRASAQLTLQKVTDLIHAEGECLMRTWGVQFDDLTVYLQDNLDKQRASIAETRTSTFEHVDADAQRREVFWNSQWKEIISRHRQYDNCVQELRDDQERSFLIIVDTLVSLKTKCQSISDRMDELEEIEPKTGFTSKFGKYDAKLQSLKNAVDHVMKDIEDITEDRESVQNVFASSVELFNSKIDCCFDYWSKQFEGIEKRIKEKIGADDKQIQSLNKHRREIEAVVTAMCKKIVYLTSKVENQLSELETLKTKISDKHDSHEFVEGGRNDSIVKYMNVDRKKYKKILWKSRQKSCTTFGEDRENEVEFYDLTLASSPE